MKNALASYDMHGRRSELRVDLHAGVVLGGEKEQRAEQVIEAPARATENDRVNRLPL